MIGGFGTTELIIVLVIVLLIFGAGKLTDVGGALGKSIREFRKATREDDAPEADITATAETKSPTQ